MKSHIYILFFAFLFISNGLTKANERFSSANEKYQSGEYYEAIEIYESILDSGVESYEVYYNLGNSYYRSNNLPAAILNYERGLLLAPQDSDIRYNLELAYSQITDKIEPIGQFFISKWFKSIRNVGNSTTWAWVSIICFTLFLVGMLIYFFSQKTVIRKLAFTLGIWALISSAITFTYSNTQKRHLENRTEAVVFTPSVTVKSAPQGGGTDLFVIHEGLKVKILQTIGNWHEIMLEDGNVGWMKDSDLVVI